MVKAREEKPAPTPLYLCPHLDANPRERLLICTMVTLWSLLYSLFCAVTDLSEAKPGGSS